MDKDKNRKVIILEDELDRRARTILGVAPGASIRAIKKSYYRLARKYHPDINKDDLRAHKKFQAVDEAYDLLCGNRNYELCELLDDKLVEELTGQPVTPLSKTKTMEQKHFEQYYDYEGKSIWA